MNIKISSLDQTYPYPGYPEPTPIKQDMPQPIKQNMIKSAQEYTTQPLLDHVKFTLQSKHYLFLDLLTLGKLSVTNRAFSQKCNEIWQAFAQNSQLPIGQRQHLSSGTLKWKFWHWTTPSFDIQDWIYSALRSKSINLLNVLHSTQSKAFEEVFITSIKGKEWGDWENFNTFLRSKMNIDDVRDSKGRTILMIAVSHHRDNIIEKILLHFKISKLDDFLKNANTPRMQTFLQARDQDGNTVFMIAKNQELEFFDDLDTLDHLMSISQQSLFERTTWDLRINRMRFCQTLTSYYMAGCLVFCAICYLVDGDNTLQRIQRNL